MFNLACILVAVSVLTPQEDLKTLVDKLDSSEINVRSEATRLLCAKGAAAEAALKLGLTTLGAEGVERARQILRRIELSRLISANLQAQLPQILDAVWQKGWTPAIAGLFESEGRGEMRKPAVGVRDLAPLLHAALDSSPSAADLKILLAIAEDYPLTPASFPKLEACLRRDGEHSDLREAALRALTPTMARQAAPVLLEILRKKDDPLRDDVLRVLPPLGLREAIPDLIAILKDPKSEQRGVAAMTLAEFGSRDALDDMAELFSLEGYGALQILGGPESLAAVARSVKTLGDRQLEPESEVALIACLESLGELGELPGLLRMAEDTDPRLRRLSVLALGRLQDDSARDILLKRLKEDADPRIRAGAALALRRVDPARWAAILPEALQDKDPEVVNAVAEAAADFPEGVARPDLKPLLIHRSPAVRAAAARVVGLLGMKDCRPALAGLLRDADVGVVNAAALGLGFLGDEAVAAKLEALFKDPDATLAAAALMAYAHLPAKTALPRLKAELSTSPKEQRSTALNACFHAAGSQVPELLALMDLEDLPAKRKALRKLAELGAPEAAPKVKELLRASNDPFVLKAALDYAAATRARSLAPDVLQMLDRTKGNKMYRDEALTLLCFGGTDDVNKLLVSRVESQKALSPELAWVTVAAQPAAAAAAWRKVLREGGSGGRTIAIAALSRTGDAAAADDLRPYLNSRFATTRAAALTGLARLEGGKLTATAKAFLSDFSPEVRRASAEALGLLGAVDAGAEIKALGTDPDPDVRLCASKALILLGNKEGLVPFFTEYRRARVVNGGTGFLELNRIHQPKLWARLASERLRADLWGLAKSNLESLAKADGLRLDIGPGTAASDPSAQSWIGIPAFGGRTTLLEAWDAAAGGSDELVFEADRVRVMTRSAALRFWLRQTAASPQK